MALWIDPDLPARLAVGRPVVLVSATNGKTTVVTLLAEALRATGRRVASNEDGANLLPGLTAALASDRDADVSVLEVDEAQLPVAIALLDPALVVLGNLSRDQLDRHHEVRALARRWHEALAARPTQVVATSSDPNVVWAAGAATWVDLGGVQAGDSPTCPNCGLVLVTADSWDCACGFTRPPAWMSVAGGVATADGVDHDLHLDLTGSWQSANAALALAAAMVLGLDGRDAARTIRHVSTVGGRRTRHRLPDGREAEVVLAKNPASWSAILDHVTTRDCGIVVGANDRAADGADTSWLWDVPFERLRGREVAAAGDRRLDVAVRLAQAGVQVRSMDRDPLVAARSLRTPAVVLGVSYSLFRPLVTT